MPMLYNDTIEIEFSPKGHRYKVGGAKKLGVTTVLNRVIAKEGLLPWAANLAAQTFLEALEGHLTTTGSYDGFDTASALALAKRAHVVRKEAGADVGTLVHDWISQYIASPLAAPALPNDKQAKLGIAAFLEWASVNNVKFIKSEQVVYSKLHDYCGTYDVKFEIDGKLYLGDFKTSDPKREYLPRIKQYTGRSMAYPEHFIQVGAYSLADLEESGHNVDGHMVIYITKTGQLFSFTDWSVAKNQQAFVHALRLYRDLERLQ